MLKFFQLISLIPTIQNVNHIIKVPLIPIGSIINILIIYKTIEQNYMLVHINDSHIILKISSLFSLDQFHLV